jgi:hypothetical protein
MPYQLCLIIGITMLFALLIPITIHITLAITNQKAITVNTEVRLRLVNYLLKEYRLKRLLNTEKILELAFKKNTGRAEFHVKNQLALNRPESFKDQIKILRFILGSILVKKLEWNSIIGFDNAMYTAIGVGSLWALKGNLLSFLSAVTHLETCFVHIQPDYSNSTISSQICCILKIRMVHIILIGVYAFGLNVRGYWRGISRKAKPSD